MVFVGCKGLSHCGFEIWEIGGVRGAFRDARSSIECPSILDYCDWGFHMVMILSF